MDFYLVRHGEAKSEAEDPRRPLSDQGRKEVERVASTAGKRSLGVSQILHSDKLRARETAEILARYLSPPGGVHEIKGLGPQDDPLVAKAELEAAQSSLMLVGHLPHLGRLVSMLVIEDPDKEVVDFPAAAIVCLSHGEDVWKVCWTLVSASA